MSCKNLNCPFWDDGTRFSCNKLGFSCLNTNYPVLLKSKMQ